MSYTKLTGLKDYLGNLVPGAYSMNTNNIYCNDVANGDTFNITNLKGNVIGICTTAGELQMSFVDELTGGPPITPATLLPSTEQRVFIPREIWVWYYIPKDVDTIWFYADRTGIINCVTLNCPDQFEDSPT